MWSCGCFVRMHSNFMATCVRARVTTQASQWMTMDSTKCPDEREQQPKRKTRKVKWKNQRNETNEKIDETNETKTFRNISSFAYD